MLMTPVGTCKNSFTKYFQRIRFYFIIQVCNDPQFIFYYARPGIRLLKMCFWGMNLWGLKLTPRNVVASSEENHYHYHRQQIVIIGLKKMRSQLILWLDFSSMVYISRRRFCYKIKTLNYKEQNSFWPWFFN